MHRQGLVVLLLSALALAGCSSGAGKREAEPAKGSPTTTATTKATETTTKTTTAATKPTTQPGAGSTAAAQPPSIPPIFTGGLATTYRKSYSLCSRLTLGEIKELGKSSDPLVAANRIAEERYPPADRRAALEGCVAAFVDRGLVGLRR
jgi:hypothetical protein